MKNKYKAILLGILLAIGAWYETILLSSGEKEIKLQKKHWISLGFALLIALLLFLDSSLGLGVAR